MRFNRIPLLFFFILFFAHLSIKAQSVLFTAPDTVCVNTPVEIKNLSTGITSSYWNFCVSSINIKPSATNLGNVGGLLRMPVFIDNVFQNGNYYGFLVNNDPGKLIRLDFGNSLLNTPTATSLGDFGGIIPRTAEGIQVVEQDGRWYAIIVGGTPLSGGTPRILKIDFGANLNNPNPVATNWGNIGNMDQSIDLYLFKDQENWFGFTTNSSNNSITRFNFGKNFSNPPSATNLGSFGSLSYPTGIYTINDNGYWRIFVTNGISNTITRLDFGSSLLNNPIPVNLGSLSNTLSQPRDIYIMKLCEETVGFVVNGITNTIVKLDFVAGLDKIPEATSLGNIGNMSFPHSISQLFREGSNIYSLVPNVSNNTLTRLEFKGCTDASLLNSSSFDPPPVIYSKPGTYNINLMVDEGLPSQTSVCRTIVVIEKPNKSPTTISEFCEGDSILLKSNFPKGNILWNTGSTENSIWVNNPGTYWVSSDMYGCSTKDSMIVSQNLRPVVSIGNDTTICKQESLVLDAGNAFIKYLWQDGSTQQSIVAQKAQKYSVIVTNSKGCTGKDSINLTLAAPDIQMSKDTTICFGSAIRLFALSDSRNKFAWMPDPGLSDLTIFNPLAMPLVSTRYFISVTDEDGCKTEDSVLVNVAQLPVVNSIQDTSVCSGSSIILATSGAPQTSYQWTPEIFLSNASAQSPVVTPLTGTTYTLTAKNEWGCITQSTVKIDLKPSPTVKAFGDTTICSSISVPLTSVYSDAKHISWYPDLYLNNSGISNPVASPLETMTFKVTVTGYNQCIAEDSVTIRVFSKPSFELQPSSVEICERDSAVFTASGGDVYQWFPNPDFYPVSTSSAGFFPKDNMTYQVIITDNNCLLSDTLSAKVYIKPKESLLIKKSNDINCNLGQAILSAIGGESYRWYPTTGLSSPLSSITFASPSETTTYHLEALTNNGCISNDSIQVFVQKADSHSGYQLPNAFSPNNDGINDCFGIQKWGAVTELQFSIYNRWGERVFYTSDAAVCWDGRFKGVDQNSGFFVYYIRGKGNCGFIERKGTVLLLR